MELMCACLQLLIHISTWLPRGSSTSPLGAGRRVSRDSKTTVSVKSGVGSDWNLYRFIWNQQSAFPIIDRHSWWFSIKIKLKALLVHQLWDRISAKSTNRITQFMLISFSFLFFCSANIFISSLLPQLWLCFRRLVLLKEKEKQKYYYNYQGELRCTCLL